MRNETEFRRAFCNSESAGVQQGASHRQRRAMNMTEKTLVEVALLLPKIPNAHDACVQRLRDLLKAKEGIEDAHL